MSIIKKISLVVLSLVVIFSVALSASAVTVSTSTQGGYFATPEQLDIINSAPEVYVFDLVLDKATYKPGETVSGSFSVINSKETKTPNIFFNTFLAGGYNGGDLNKYEYGIQKSDLFLLAPKEKREIKFSYKLPMSAEGYGTNDILKIKIKAHTENGWPLGWQDTMITVVGDNLLSNIKITSPSVKVANKTYSLEAGPTVHAGEKASLSLKINNPSDKEIKVTPQFSIFGQEINSTPLKSYSEKQIILKAKETADLEYVLPDFDFTPLVYTGELSFVDGSNIARSNVVKFRYIIGGDIVNIHNITADKGEVAGGEKLTLKMLFTGTPIDISKLEQNFPVIMADVDIKVFNESDALVASYINKIDINKLPNSFDLMTQTGAKAMRVEATISREGKILDEYKADLSADYTEVKRIALAEAQRNRYMVYAGILLLVIIIIIVAIKMFRKNKKIALLSLMLLILCLPILKIEAFTATGSWHEWDWNGYYGGTQILVNSPSPVNVRTYYPGEVFNFSGTTYIPACINGPSKILVYAGLSSASSLVYDSGAFNAGCNNGTDYCQRSKDFSYGSFTAPTTPGTYTLYIKVKSYYTPDGVQTSELNGYQNFTVAPWPPTNLTATCPSPGTAATLSWSPVTGANYLVMVNKIDSPTVLWKGNCSVAQYEGDICPTTPQAATTFSFPGTPGSTYGWWVHSIINGVWSSPATTTALTCTPSCSTSTLMYQNTTQRTVDDPATSTYEFGKDMVVDKIEIDWNDSNTNCAAYLRLGSGTNLNIYQIPKASGEVGPYDVCTNCDTTTVSVNVPNIISNKLSFGVIDKPYDSDLCGTVKINSVKVYGKVDSCATASCSATNLITNGDFQNGFTGFTTEYSLQAYPGSTSLEPAGTVGLIVDPIQVNKYFISFLDKTFGNYSSGRMLISNGAVDTTGNPARMKDIVCTNITVEPNTDYYLSAWVRTAVSTPSNPARDARPQFFVNGVSITNDNPVTDTAWVNKEGEWNSGSTTTAKFCIRTNSTVLEGNDLAVDDMWFGKGDLDLCSTATTTFSASCSVTSATNSSIAPSTVTWTATATGGTGPYTYSNWTGTDLTSSATTSTITKEYTATGTKQVSVKVTDSANASTTIACYGAVAGSGGCTSNCGVTITDGSVTCGSYNLTCIPGSITATDVTDTATEYRWSCGTTSCSIPIPITPTSNPVLNCNLSMTPYAGLVNVNTNTIWTATSTTGLDLSSSQYTKTWVVIDSNNLTPGTQINDSTPTDNKLDKIFTTIGQKIIGLTVSTSTAFGTQCTATTTVVQTGGSGGEI